MPTDEEMAAHPLPSLMKARERALNDPRFSALVKASRTLRDTAIDQGHVSEDDLIRHAAALEQIAATPDPERVVARVRDYATERIRHGHAAVAAVRIGSDLLEIIGENEGGRGVVAALDRPAAPDSSMLPAQTAAAEALDRMVAGMLGTLELNYGPHFDRATFMADANLIRTGIGIAQRSAAEWQQAIEALGIRTIPDIAGVPPRAQEAVTPQGPRIITMEQRMAAARALGFDPATVQRIVIDSRARSIKVTQFAIRKQTEGPSTNATPPAASFDAAGEVLIVRRYPFDAESQDARNAR